MIAGETDLDALFKRLHLANARRVWRDLVQRAERESWAYRDFLALLVTEEIAHRQQTRLARLTRRAHFPFLKTIDDFNFTYQSSLRVHMLGSALAPDFVTEGRTLIFTGKPGRGKTHLAIAVAYRAIQNGFDAFFTTAATLIDDLSAAFRAGELAQALPTYTHPAVLVVDEVGYLTYGTDAANMLFHVVNERHRRLRPMIFTTNKSLKGWGKVLHDEDLAQAIIDRVLERGRLLRLDGPSVRTLHVNLDEAMKEGSDQDADLVRISWEDTVGRIILGKPARGGGPNRLPVEPRTPPAVPTGTRRSFRFNAIAKFLREQMLAGPAGLEPATSWFVARRSIQLSYGPLRSETPILALFQPGVEEPAPPTRLTIGPARRRATRSTPAARSARRRSLSPHAPAVSRSCSRRAPPPRR